MITESFLHFVWKHKIFHKYPLQTTDGRSIQIIHSGFSHQDAGPDFKQAIIKIENITWAGDIEIHINSSDWYKHGHHLDKKYSIVILHVVYIQDVNVRRSDHEFFPALELKNLIPDEVIEKYRDLLTSSFSLPCKEQLQTITTLQFSSILSRLMLERLTRRQKQIFQIFEQSQKNWNELIFKLLIINFGFKTNSAAFELLSRILPYKILCKHTHSKFQVYALVFGQAGMLEEWRDDKYYLSLQTEYKYLQQKYKLIPMPERIWNLLRLRPQNFPCIRLAQLSETLCHHFDFLTNIENFTTIEQFEKMFSYQSHDYWKTHYYFGKVSKEHTTNMGYNTFELIMINTIIPALYSYGAFMGNEQFQERAILLLETLCFEKNNLTKSYRQCGFPSESALHSQAILELNKRYCTKKNCLECLFWGQIVANNSKN